MDKETGQVLGADQTISRDEALAGYTRNIAELTFESALKGTLERGKLADMVVLDKDLFGIPVDKIKDINVEMTIVGGQVVYQRTPARSTVPSH